jgi:uncharacterized membrane protein YdjX (TVP38/TMEM64 family)
LIDFIEELRLLGPLLSIGIVMIESFVPILPLIAFVSLNVYLHGPVMGYLYSYAGNVIGSVLVFMFFRNIVKGWFDHKIQTHPHIKRVMKWINEHGEGTILLMVCFPFSPSVAINIAAGLSTIPSVIFFIILGVGKAIMMLLMTYVGFSFSEFLEKPWHTGISIAMILVVMYVGKRLEKKYFSK